MPQRFYVDIGSMTARCMDLGLRSVRPQSFENGVEARVATLRSLHRHCLTHDGASARNDLEVGNCPSAGRKPTGGGRETAEGCGASGFQERAHRARLSEESVHDCRKPAMERNKRTKIENDLLV